MADQGLLADPDTFTDDFVQIMTSAAAIHLRVLEKYDVVRDSRRLYGVTVEECIARSGGETSSDLMGPEKTAERKAFES